MFVSKWSSRPTPRPARRFDFSPAERRRLADGERTIFLTLCANSNSISQRLKLARHAKAGNPRVAQHVAWPSLSTTARRRIPSRSGSLISLYTAPWPATEFAADFRLPAGNRNGLGFVFGHVDAANYWRVFSIPAPAHSCEPVRQWNGSRRAQRSGPRSPSANGTTSKSKPRTTIEVSYDDGALELKVNWGRHSAVAIRVPGPGQQRRGIPKLHRGGEARTPRVSIVSCPAYEQSAETTDLLTGSSTRFQPSAGISPSRAHFVIERRGLSREFEWAVVIRRYADGAVANEEGDTFEFRMVDADGAAFGGSAESGAPAQIPPGRVGGTFVETPGRIVPWQARNGDLYFIMEPAETDNVFMMIKSTDNGVTWREVDGANRPETNDLESVDARQVSDTIHIIHQVTGSTRYHAFRTSDHPTQPDTWGVRDEVAATASSVAQAATLAVRSDGSMVTFYVADTVHYNIRSPQAPGEQTPSSTWVAQKRRSKGGARRQRHRPRRLLRRGRHNLVSAAAARRHVTREAAARVGPGHLAR